MDNFLTCYRLIKRILQERASFWRHKSDITSVSFNSMESVFRYCICEGRPEKIRIYKKDYILLFTIDFSSILITLFFKVFFFLNITAFK